MPKRKHSDTASSSSSVDTKMISFESMKAQVECPICTEVPRDGVMLMCVNGHNVCGVCKEKLGPDAKCPQGRCDFNTPPTKNFTVTNMIDIMSFEFQCKHSKGGCKFSGACKSLAAHEASCEFRLVSCPQHDCKLRLPANLIFEHLQTEHRVELANNYNCTENRAFALLFWERGWTVNEGFHWLREVIMPHHDLALCSSFQEGKLSVWLWTEMDEKTAGNFECRITLMEGRTSVKSVCPLYPLDWDRDRIMADDDCLKIDWSLFKKMLTEKKLTQEEIQEGNLKITIRFEVLKKTG